MSLWVVGAAQMGARGLNLLGVASGARVERAFASAQGRLERRQIAEASRFDAQARIRHTGALIGAQRAALGASGVAGGRTARLLEANARLAASRQQEQMDMQTVLQRTASTMQQRQVRGAARLRVIQAAGDLLGTGMAFESFRRGLPPGG